MNAYVFAKKYEQQAEVTLDEWNVSDPGIIFSGPYAGMLYFDAELPVRDERWKAVFGRMLQDPAYGVQFVDLALEDLIPNTFK